MSDEPKKEPDMEYEIDPEGAENAVLKKPGFGKSESELVADLKAKLAEALREKKEYLEGWQRAKADYANARKDEEKSMAKFAKFSKEEIIRDILPALDSFHSAFGNKAAWEKVDLNWRMGVQYIYSQLLSAMEKNGITLIEPSVGEPFDAERHESMATIPTSKEGDNHTVAEVIQKGYSFHGKILQPAKIKLAEYQENK